MDLPDDLKQSYQNGILIGTPQQIVFNQRQMNDVIYWLSQRSEFHLVPEELPDVAYSYPRVLKVDDLHQATVYRLDEHIALQDMELVRSGSCKFGNCLCMGPSKTSITRLWMGTIIKQNRGEEKS